MCLQPKPTSRLTGGGSGRSPAESWDLLKKIPITASNENRKIKNDTEIKDLDIDVALKSIKKDNIGI